MEIIHKYEWSGWGKEEGDESTYDFDRRWKSGN